MYEDLTDLTALKTAMETALNEYNLSPAVVPMQLVLFREAIEHSEHSLIPPPSQCPNYGVFPRKYRSLLRSLPNLSNQILEVTFLPGPRCPCGNGWGFSLIVVFNRHGGD